MSEYKENPGGFMKEDIIKNIKKLRGKYPKATSTETFMTRKHKLDSIAREITQEFTKEDCWKVEAEELAIMVLQSDNLEKLKEVTLLNYPELKDHVREVTKKVYKLSDMWKGWYKEDGRNWISCTEYFESKENLLKQLDKKGLLAITKADATDFYQGQGL